MFYTIGWRSAGWCLTHITYPTHFRYTTTHMTTLSTALQLYPISHRQITLHPMSFRNHSTHPTILKRTDTLRSYAYHVFHLLYVCAIARTTVCTAICTALTSTISVLTPKPFTPILDITTVYFWLSLCLPAVLFTQIGYPKLASL